MKRTCFHVLIVLVVSSANAQPFIDVVSANYVNSPDAGLWRRNRNKNDFVYYNISTTVPLQLRNKDYFIVSPFFEKWSLNFVLNKSTYQKDLYSVAIPLSYQKAISKNWSLLATFIVRENDSIISAKGRMQLGGALIASYKKTEKLTYKTGIYMNGEFFGLFVVPLLGIDWRIDKKNNLFGVLPGKLSFEHKMTSRIFVGLNFRALTNSYASPYYRIDENELGIFSDFYVAKKLAVTIEGGHSILRQLRLEPLNARDIQTRYSDANPNDNFFCKIGVAYRIRLDEK